ncbi:DNA helicase-2/ATP-dependent DNA helicase PcrA [Microbacteriaceae bacterium SG_E_30_P1]|uniref:DNA 3'-5' helicase n=1 Tax=Antiquaquibacter oligotrophicus TaxID=2880260 RepID=A0ABT6KMV6_9MICO|nr:ATP-dependent helicase [Antiquaquibacter oligotrophicus]MDH6180432.1 DNA helicase-2/ATP-dependent DNA helicase PcrA [Antiquaquibacter oligotrophicus]UDF13830.1 ATP-dependent helicase [Antiquaquibacter oligotrophicus]
MSTAADLLASLDDQQRAAAEALLGPVCILAGAGTGKTRAVTHRIAYGVASGVYPPGRVMALTFTARAAGELRVRLRGLGVEGVAARTFHASALSQLNYFWPQVIGGTMPRLLDSKARLLAHAADELRLRLDTATLRDVAAEIEWRKTSRLTIDEYAARERPALASLSADRVVDLQTAYERVKDDRRQLDFEDVLLAAAGMIESEPRVAQQVREQYRFFIVDEYQDVSPLQHDLLRLWLGPRTDVCVVGDVSQTIYTFAGASPDYLLGFATEFSEASVLRLEHNYRSTPEVVGAANRLMKGEPGALHLVAAASPGPEPTITAYETDQAEARGIAAAIRGQLDAGADASDIAVLFRINAQSQALEAALDAAGVPYQVRGATRFFEQREVVEAIMLLRGATLGATDAPLERSVSDVLSSLGWTPTPPEAAGAVRSRWESLDALLGLAREAPPGTSLRAFVDDLTERQAAQHEPTLSAVTLTTIHSAKGLEWGSVYLVGLAEGLLPLSYAKDDRAIAEEKRLLYVGITRARERLAMSWAAGSTGLRSARRMSRFLDRLE